MAPPVAPETLLLAAAYLGLFVGLSLVVRNLQWLDDGGDDPETSTEDMVSCPDCGRANEDGFAYCRHCATDLGASAGAA